MSQYVESSEKAFIAGGPIAQHLRVKLSGGKLALAAQNEYEIGTIMAASFADGDVRGVRLRTAEGSCKMMTLGAISAGAKVYGAANGRIGIGSIGTVSVGVALEAASGTGSVIEVART